MRAASIDPDGAPASFAAVLIEVRQDLVATQVDADAWARRLEGVLRPVLAQPRAHMIEHHGSRAGDPSPQPRTRS